MRRTAMTATRTRTRTAMMIATASIHRTQLMTSVPTPPSSSCGKACSPPSTGHHQTVKLRRCPSYLSCPQTPSSWSQPNWCGSSRR